MFKLFKSSYALLDARDKKSFYFLIFLCTIAMIMEVFGLSLIIPVVSIILNDNIYGLNPYFDRLLNFFNNPGKNFILYLFLSIFISFYFLKSLFSTFLIFKQNSFLSFLKAKISKQIFETYLYKEYSFFLDMKSSEILRNIRRETDLFLEVVVQATIVVITEFFIVLGILTLLLYFQPLGSLAIIFVIIIVIYLHRLFTKKITYQYGKRRQDSETTCIQIVQQSLSSIITIKLKKIENEILNNYNTHARIEADAQRFQGTMQELPRLWLELIAVIGLALFIIVIQFQGSGSAEMVSTLAIFAGASFKVLPSMNRIFTSIQKLRYGHPIMKTINKIYSDHKSIYQSINLEDEVKIKNLESEKIINFLEIKNLEFKYNNKKDFVFKHLNLLIKENEKIGITGDSGTGKSTLVNLILGLLRPINGEILFKTTNIEKVKNYYHQNIAYVPQNIFLLNDSILNNIIFGSEKNGDINLNKISEILKILKLDEFIESLPNNINTVISESSSNISGGQKQRIGLARALYSNPAFLLLDEATSALDSESERFIIEKIFNLKTVKNIVIVSHNTDNFTFCDRILKIEDLKIK